MSFTRTLTFRCKDLGRDSTLLLTFNDEAIPGMYRDVFPTAFKVAMFGATGSYEFKVVYNSEFGFTRAQINGGIVVPASVYTHIDVGQETTLTKKGSPAVYSFSKPQPIVPPTTEVVAINGTDTRENIGVGFFDSPDGAPTAVLVFTNVGPASKVQPEFIPILRGYITPDYQEGEIMKGQITPPILFTENLVRLDQDTYWKLTYNEGTGVYKIVRDET